MPDVTQSPVHPGIQEIHDLLYLDADASAPIYDADKSWDADTIAAIAQVIARYIPRPGHKGDQ